MTGQHGPIIWPDLCEGEGEALMPAGTVVLGEVEKAKNHAEPHGVRAFYGEG